MSGQEDICANEGDGEYDRALTDVLAALDRKQWAQFAQLSTSLPSSSLYHFRSTKILSLRHQEEGAKTCCWKSLT